MTKPRWILGLVGGGLIAVSSAAHSLLGWKALGAELAAVEAPADLVRALAIGWHFAGLAMLLFGLIAGGLLAARLRGRPAPLWPVAAIGTLYVGFGAGAMAFSGGRPFFLVFVIPGLLLLLATPGAGRRTAAAPPAT
jgi:hypothetical protein